MERFGAKCIVAALAAFMFVCATGAAEQPADIWYHDVDAAWAKAKENGRPLVLYITTDGCFYCDKMVKDTCNNASVVKELSEGFVPVVVHAGKNRELVRRMGVQAYPTTVIVSKDAKIIAAMPGYLNVAQMRETLRVARVELSPRR